MTAGSRVLAYSSSSSSSSSVSIPSNARKVIQDLKEIINNTNISDEEIYSVLRECNMDPNETVQKLLNQDTFHEVKRKRDKKKENASKEATEVRSRAPGSASTLRGGRYRGRGNYLPRDYNSNGRGQSLGKRNNSLQQNGRLEEMQEQTKASSSSISSGYGLGATPTSHIYVPNGTSNNMIVQGTRGGWGVAAGQATMAEILKSRNASHGNANASMTSKLVAQQPLDPPDEDTLPSSADHEAESYVDSGSGGGSLHSDESSSFQEHLEKSSDIHHSTTYDHVDRLPPILANVKSVNSDIHPPPVKSPDPREHTSSLETSAQVDASSLQPTPGLDDLSQQSSSAAGNQGNRSVLNVTEREKGTGLDWRPKSPVTSGHSNMEAVMSSISKLNLQEDQPVTIPDHLQVPEAGRAFPTFGSFGEDYDSNVNSADEHEDDKRSGISAEGNLPDEAAPLEQSNPTSLKPSVCINDDHKNQSLTYVDTLVAREDAKLNMGASVNIPIPQTEVAKPETAVQKTSQHSIPSGMHNYPGPTPIPQISYVDPSTNVNYFNPAFRPNTEIDARYVQFVSATTANKLAPPVVGQAPSHESGSSIALPIAAPTAPPSTIPQQHIGPIHAYPAQHAGVPMTPFGANVFGIHYVPPNYGYMHSPYQHNYAGNTSYPQAPGSNYAHGSNYVPTVGAAFASANAGPMKYALPQYKPPGASAGTGSHSTGYGSNFGGSPSGFTTINSAVTSTTASGYSDVNGPQNKESNVYIPRLQHAEGSGVWIQNTPAREITPIQTNSYYNLIGQGQHTSFSHAQPMHSIPAAATYANLYHQSPSGSAPAAHQMLSHPQVLSGVVGTQTGAFQPQQHRVQPNWPQNY